MSAELSTRAIQAENARLRAAMKEACDLLAERIHGNAARSPGHNARVVLEWAMKEGPAPSPLSNVLGAIAAERARQIAAGYDAAHDDAHVAGDIINSSWGASARIYAAQDRGMSGDVEGYTKYLIQAAAQIVAEIERVQRAALSASEVEG